MNKSDRKTWTIKTDINGILEIKIRSIPEAEIDDIPVTEQKQCLVDTIHEDPQPKEPEDRNNDIGIFVRCCLAMIGLLAIGLLGGYILGKDDGKDVYTAQFEEAAVGAAQDFAAIAERCGWIATIDEDGAEIDDYEGAFIDVRVEKYLGFGDSLRYDIGVCVHPGSTSYEVNGKSYGGLDEWREALTQYGEGRDYDGTMPEPEMIREPVPEPPHEKNDPVAKPEFQQPAP